MDAKEIFSLVLNNSKFQQFHLYKNSLKILQVFSTVSGYVCVFTAEFRYQAAKYSKSSTPPSLL